MPPDLAQWVTLISKNHPCLEHIFMVPKVFEPVKFYCIGYFSGVQILRKFNLRQLHIIIRQLKVGTFIVQMTPKYAAVL